MSIESDIEREDIEYIHGKVTIIYLLLLIMLGILITTTYNVSQIQKQTAGNKVLIEQVLKEVKK